MEQYQSGVTGFSRFVEIMDTKPEEDAPNATDAGELNGKIEFKDVVYAYDDEKDVLNGINITIEKGKKYTLVILNVSN